MASDAASCTVCGEGVYAAKTDRVTKYDLVNGSATLIPVTTSQDDCCKCVGWARFKP